MIEFKPITLDCQALYKTYLTDAEDRGCDYSFANVYLWGEQMAAILYDHLILFSQFGDLQFYSYPAGTGEKMPVLDAIIADAKERGIPCKISGITAKHKQALEELYPDRFCFHCNRDTFDYIYNIDDLADLKGKKFDGKRNHLHRFRDAFPDYAVEPLGEDNLPLATEMINKWYEVKQKDNPQEDYDLEHIALSKALQEFAALEMEGLILHQNDTVLAIALGSRLSDQIFDVHFEKASWDANGAYAAINYEFARYIRDKYPDVRFLNREDDMGIEGLRRAKISYHPHYMIEKYWACLREDGYGD